MPPTATTSTGGGTPTAIPIDSTPTLSSGFAGEEFINNLGSDLAPLLTLFGEQVTKQFLSMSLGWADHILLAVGPLGIITTVVSAIRVSNVRVLKAIIGRAREKLATAELELPSSTSDATSELWTEEGIVRQPGHAKILEMVVYKSKPTEMTSSHDGTELEVPSETHIGDLSEAYSVGVLTPIQKGRWRSYKALSGKFDHEFWTVPSIAYLLGNMNNLAKMHAEIVERNAIIARLEASLDELTERAEIALLTERAESDSGRSAWSEEQGRSRALTTMDRRAAWIAETAGATTVAQNLVRRLANQPPNLILNVHDTFPKSAELWALVIIGMALQLVAVVIPAIMTYHWREPKGSNPVQGYAYPTFLLGTCVLAVSIALCSYIIEETTVEQVFTPTDGYEVENIFRLQLRQNMGDQLFKSYVILNHAEDKKIRTSRYDPGETFEDENPHNLGAGIRDDISDFTSNDSPASRSDHVRRSLSGASSYDEPAVYRARRSRNKAQNSMVIIAVVLCFVGFICQFVGLRALHWSATVIQLSITLLMTCIRAWIRRGISNQPIAFQLPSYHPDWIALSLGTACQTGWPPKNQLWPTRIVPKFRFCPTLPELRSVPVTRLISIEDPRIQLRQKLESSTTEDSDLLPQVEALLSCMHNFFIWLNPRNQGQSRPITWSHIVHSEDLNDSSPRYSRLTLTMSFDHSPFQAARYESSLHALLSILRYGSGGLPGYRCVTRVYSQEDWIKKREFLMAQLQSTTADGGLHPMSYLSTTYDHFNYEQGHMNSDPHWRKFHLFAGTSIENMQPATGPSTAGSNSSGGYLIVPLEESPSDIPELLAGFMDAVCHKSNPKYHHAMESWYVETEGRSQRIELDHIVDKFKDTELMITETQARLLVVTSLARCTVWKDSALADDPNPASIQLPKPSLPARHQHISYPYVRLVS